LPRPSIVCGYWFAERSLCIAVGEEIKVDELVNKEYPLGIKLAQIFVTGGTVVIFFTVLFWSFQGWAAFLSLFGTYKVRSYSEGYFSRICLH